MPSNDLKQILERIQAKDPAGFELLHQHHFRFLFSVAYAVLNNEEDSYDVVQSVMMRLYQLDEALFPRDHERSWLKTVVKNEALMHLRQEKAAIPLEEAAELPAMDRHIEDFVDMDAFRRLTAPLSERQRKVVTLKILGDLTHRGIAQMLSLPTGTVQWIYASSIKKLRRSLAALASLALLSGGGFVYQLTRYLQVPAEMPGDVGISSIPAAEPALSPWLPVFLVLFLVSAAGCVLFLKYSDRIPTKRLTRRI